MKSKNNHSTPKKTYTKPVMASLADAYREAAPYFNIGYFFLSSIVVFMLIGYFIDNRIDPASSTYMTWGAVVGILLGFYNFFKIVSNRSK